MEDMVPELGYWLQRLSKELDAPPLGQTSVLSHNFSIATHDQTDRNRIADWLDEHIHAYQAAFERIQS